MSKENLECICGNDNKFVVIGNLKFCEECGLNQIEIEKHSQQEENLECICGNDNKFVVIGNLKFCEECGLNQIEIEKHPKHSENETTENS